MPTVSQVSLDPPVTMQLNTTLTVHYNATFSAHERRLAALLMPITETFTIQGMDGGLGATIGGPFTKTLSPQGVLQGVADPNAASSITVPVESVRTVSRSSLQEDPPGDNDEVRVKIQLAMGSFPLANEGNSDIEIIAG